MVKVDCNALHVYGLYTGVVLSVCYYDERLYVYVVVKIVPRSEPYQLWNYLCWIDESGHSNCHSTYHLPFLGC